MLFRGRKQKFLQKFFAQGIMSAVRGLARDAQSMSHEKLIKKVEQLVATPAG